MKHAAAALPDTTSHQTFLSPASSNHWELQQLVSNANVKECFIYCSSQNTTTKIGKAESELFLTNQRFWEFQLVQKHFLEWIIIKPEEGAGLCVRLTDFVYIHTHKHMHNTHFFHRGHIFSACPLMPLAADSEDGIMKEISNQEKNVFSFLEQ